MVQLCVFDITPSLNPFWKVPYDAQYGFIIQLLCHIDSFPTFDIPHNSSNIRTSSSSLMWAKNEEWGSGWYMLKCLELNGVRVSVTTEKIELSWWGVVVFWFQGCWLVIEKLAKWWQNGVAFDLLSATRLPPPFSAPFPQSLKLKNSCKLYLFSLSCCYIHSYSHSSCAPLSLTCLLKKYLWYFMLDLCSQCICTYHVEWSKYKIKSKFDVWPLMVEFLLHQPCKLTLTAVCRQSIRQT